MSFIRFSYLCLRRRYRTVLQTGKIKANFIFANSQNLRIFAVCIKTDFVINNIVYACK